MQADPHIGDTITNIQHRWISLEYFPPRTEAGVVSLHKLNEKLKAYNPQFVDVTWGAGGSTSSLTLSLCVDMKEKTGVIPNLHLTCTNMEHEKIKEALDGCKAAGITNIVALRGDPPAGQETWEVVEGGFACALDLVRYIRKEHGNYFNLSVSGYPEGHPDRMTIVNDISTLTPTELARCAKLVNEQGEEIITVCKDDDFVKEMDYLVEKVNAGANCIITQMFFDVNVFVTFVNACRERGITIPIIPGIMCIATRAGFDRMTRFCKVRVPQHLRDEIANIQDEVACKELGIRFGTEMCSELIANGVNGLHFYTLNMGLVVMGIIENLQKENLIPVMSIENLTISNEGTVFDNNIAALASNV
jgi:methylenetetrahydrofolate reductase (NADPH)